VKNQNSLIERTMTAKKISPAVETAGLNVMVLIKLLTGSQSCRNIIGSEP